MINASELKERVIIKRGNELFKVVEAEVKRGTAQFSSHVFLKLKNLQTSHIIELRVDPEEKFEDVEVERVEMEYLYTDGENFYFMHPETFEQFSLPSHSIGDFSDFGDQNKS